MSTKTEAKVIAASEDGREYKHNFGPDAIGELADKEGAERIA